MIVHKGYITRQRQLSWNESKFENYTIFLVVLRLGNQLYFFTKFFRVNTLTGLLTYNYNDLEKDAMDYIDKFNNEKKVDGLQRFEGLSSLNAVEDDKLSKVRESINRLNNVG